MNNSMRNNTGALPELPLRHHPDGLRSPGGLRPVRLSRVWISEGLTQADS